MKTRKAKSFLGFPTSACSPAAKKNKIRNGSCITPQVLTKLKTIYNQNNKDQITAEDTGNILDELHRKAHCNQDECLLSSVVQDSNTRNQLNSLLFPPRAPPGWSRKPNQWLTNFDILMVLKQYEDTYPHFYFIGPSPMNYLTDRCICPNLCNFSLEASRQKYTKIGIIFNIGSHWVSLFIDLTDQFMFYFDSTRDNIPKKIQKFVNTVQEQAKTIFSKPFELFVNNKKSHQLGGTECGMYSLFFIITMLLREKPNGQTMTKEQVIALFLGKYGRITDHYIEGFRHTYFRSEKRKTKRK